MKNILVVDDETRIRQVYRQLLQGESFNVMDVANADTANEIIKRQHIDLVLLDIRMPEVRGDILYEVMQLFHRKVKVIVTSVYSLDRQRRLITGAADYYDKSQGIGVLLQKIKEVLGMA